MDPAPYSNIMQCLPTLQQRYFALTSIAAAHGLQFDVADYGGVRDEAVTEQLQAWEAEAVAAGEKPYRVAPYGESKHDYGGAFDARMKTGTLEQLGQLAGEAGLVWGGTWEPEPDLNHFELADTLEQLRAEWNDYIGQSDA